MSMRGRSCRYGWSRPCYGSEGDKRSLRVALLGEAMPDDWFPWAIAKIIVSVTERAVVVEFHEVFAVGYRSSGSLNPSVGRRERGPALHLRPDLPVVSGAVGVCANAACQGVWLEAFSIPNRGERIQDGTRDPRIAHSE